MGFSPNQVWLYIRNIRTQWVRQPHCIFASKTDLTLKKHQPNIMTSNFLNQKKKTRLVHILYYEDFKRNTKLHWYDCKWNWEHCKHCVSSDYHKKIGFHFSHALISENVQTFRNSIIQVRTISLTSFHLHYNLLYHTIFFLIKKRKIINKYCK